jgi:hypothetical protein
MQAPLITETYGRRGTNTFILCPSSKFFFISDLRKGDSEKPPTINMKFTGETLFSACSINYLTFDFILSKRGLKKETIKFAGKSMELAPLYFICKDASNFLL